MASIVPHARSYWARFLDRISRPSLSSFWRTRASMWSPRLTISWGSTSWRMDSSRAGITPSDLKPMSSRTSSLSTLTTVPLHDVAVVELDDGAGDGVLEGHAAEVVGHDLAGGVLTRLVEGPIGYRGWLVGERWSGCRRTWSRSLLSGRKPPPGSGSWRGLRRCYTGCGCPAGASPRHEQPLRVIQVRGPRGVVARASPTTGPGRARPAAAASRRSSRGVKQVVHRSKVGVRAVRVAHRRPARG